MALTALSPCATPCCDRILKPFSVFSVYSAAGLVTVV